MRPPLLVVLLEPGTEADGVVLADEPEDGEPDEVALDGGTVDVEEAEDDAPQRPVTEGTALTPVPMATRCSPQLAAWARWRLLLSWSKTAKTARRKESPRRESAGAASRRQRGFVVGC